MLMNEAGIVVGRQSFNYAEQMDNQRVSRQFRRSSLKSKEGRKAQKALLQTQNEVYEVEERLLCGRDGEPVARVPLMALQSNLKMWFTILLFFSNRQCSL
ncbi:hypothetical protein TNCV_2165441 [Trichonephila clavipes]|nr:hypothetical protein TNCV_2165441 [Trichonephila clavipes]